MDHIDFEVRIQLFGESYTAGEVLEYITTIHESQPIQKRKKTLSPETINTYVDKYTKKYDKLMKKYGLQPDSEIKCRSNLRPKFDHLVN